MSACRSPHGENPFSFVALLMLHVSSLAVRLEELRNSSLSAVMACRRQRNKYMSERFVKRGKESGQTSGAEGGSPAKYPFKQSKADKEVNRQTNVAKTDGRAASVSLCVDVVLCRLLV